MYLTAGRFDKKCGNSGIPDKAICTKRTTATKKPKSEIRLRDLRTNKKARNEFYYRKGSTKGLKNKLRLTGEIAAVGGKAILGAGIATNVARGNLMGLSAGVSTWGALSSLQAASKASRQGKTALARDFRNQAAGFAATRVGLGVVNAATRATPGNLRRANRAGRALGNAYASARSGLSGTRRKASNTAFEWEQRARGFKRSAGGSESIWAAGFKPQSQKLLRGRR